MTATRLPEAFDIIGGERRKPGFDDHAWLVSPNDLTRLEPRAVTPDAAVDRALSVAADLHERGAWSSRSPEERAALLEAVARELEARSEHIAFADAATTGVVLRTTRLLASILPAVFRAAAHELRAGILYTELPGLSGPVEVRREPWGPAAVIAPWNAPSAIASHKVASALAAGCPVVLKASEFAPHACRWIAEAVLAALADQGLPTGLLQLVHGAADVGAKIVQDARICAVSFTGGLEGGRAVARACAAQLKPVQLELGGNNPLVVLGDADLDAAADGIVLGLTTLNGQWCRALGRILVHASVARRLLERTFDRLGAVDLGSSLSPASTMGPLVHAAHLGHVRAALGRLVEAGGAPTVMTTLPPLPGHFLAPVLVTGVPAQAARDEIFGPVATVHTFTSDAEAVALANDSPFGLAAYVFGRDEERAFGVARRIRAGSIKINGVSLLALHPAAPRPAWGASGLGDEGTRETLLFFTGGRVLGSAAARAG